MRIEETAAIQSLENSVNVDECMRIGTVKRSKTLRRHAYTANMIIEDEQNIDDDIYFECE